MINWVLEYPRSGGNWVQYIVRTITGIELHKTHLYQNDKRISEDDTVVFMLRNYKESITRHTDFRAIEQFKTVLTGKADTIEPDYIYSLKFFDEFKGKKILIYYEDLIQRPEATIQYLCGFLNKTENVELFAKYLKDHIAISINLLTIKGEVSTTWKHSFDINWHSKMELNKDLKADLDSFLINEHDDLRYKYLDRYYD